ncbi:MAG: hypothetical protein WHV44_05430 [Anaerolineales bacterium]
MDALFRFLDTYEELIYIILAVAAFFNFRWVMRAWDERKNAVFGLERDFANQRLAAAVGSLVFIFMLIISVFVLVSFVFPLLPAETAGQSPTTNLMGSPVVNLAVSRTETPAPEPPFGSQGCIPNQLVITSPRPNQQVREVVELVGTVKIVNMGFYKFEVSARGANTWSTIFAGRDPKVEDTLGIWDTRGLTPGDYDLRLVVTDNQGQELPACVIPVSVAP